MLGSRPGTGDTEFKTESMDKRFSIWNSYTSTYSSNNYVDAYPTTNTKPVSPILLMSNYHKDQRLNNSWIAFKIMIEKFFKTFSR